MSKLKENFLILFVIAYTLLGAYSIAFENYPWEVAIFFFLFFAIGNGTVAHRYFAHKSFSVSSLVHPILVFWATLTAYSPLAYWIVQHRHHHSYTDTPEDTHSPVNGFFHSFFFWTVDKKTIKSVFNRRANILTYASVRKDPWIRFCDNYYIFINIFAVVILYLIDPKFVFAYFSGFTIEQARLGILNTIHHMPSFPLNYQNHKMDGDKSQNNYILGLLTLGFGWHNNHHNDPSRLILSENWWEFDLEGCVGKLLSFSKRG